MDEQSRPTATMERPVIPAQRTAPPAEATSSSRRSGARALDHAVAINARCAPAALRLALALAPRAGPGPSGLGQRSPASQGPSATSPFLNPSFRLLLLR